MENFILINNERLQYGYVANQLKSYKRHCNKMKHLHSGGDSNLHLVYSLEANMARFRLVGAICYLYKNLRLLKRENSAFSHIYMQYVRCFIDHKKSETSIDSLICLRNTLADFYSFLDDIYTIGDNRHDFEQYKVRHQWNDVTVVFETQKTLESFLDGTFDLHDFRFNTQLALKILCVEGRLKAFTDAMGNKEVSIVTAYDAAKNLLTSVSILDVYLSDNFIESSYVTLLRSGCLEILDFLKKIIEFQSGILHSDIDKFQVPKIFSSIKNTLEALKCKRQIMPSKLRSMLINTVEKRIEVDDRRRSMPFPPVFYDLANDFISYSTQDNSVAGMLRSFSFFNKSNS